MMLATTKSHMSWVPLRTTIRYREEKIAIGTAFLYTLDGRDYFVTNWHNVSGRRPWDKKPVDKINAAIPDNFVIHFPIDSQPDGPPGTKWVPKYLNLYEDDDHNVPSWWEHPNHGFSTDIAVFEVDELNPTRNESSNSDELGLTQLMLYPGMDVFVLGYPEGISVGGLFPIWKRGSIATEPEVDIDNQPLMYIDTATREGMSGAPVYAKESGVYATEGHSVQTNPFFGRGYRLIGIYSGRVGDDTFLAQLGRVWKEEAIKEIIRSKKAGTSSFYI